MHQIRWHYLTYFNISLRKSICTFHGKSQKVDGRKKSKSRSFFDDRPKSRKVDFWRPTANTNFGAKTCSDEINLEISFFGFINILLDDSMEFLRLPCYWYKIGLFDLYSYIATFPFKRTTTLKGNFFQVKYGWN